MRIALAQINPTVGDIAGNARLIETSISRAADAGADLVVFPELAVIGYPPKDLLLKPVIVQQCADAVQKLARRCTDVAALIGYPCPADSRRGRMLYNAAAFCHRGQVRYRHVKSLLPTYDVFDETRYFEPALTGAGGPGATAAPVADKSDLARLGAVTLGVTICEDLWNDGYIFERPLYHDNPARRLANLGAQIIINCSASPFVMDKHDFRLRLLGHTASRHKVPVVFCNQVGGNDELIFDGNSCVFDASGNLIAQARDFEEDLLVADVPIGPDARPASMVGAGHHEGVASVYHALVLGLRDYCRKCGFKSVVVGLSGGIDSAVTAALAVGALGKENVRGVGMPSRYSSEGSVADARELAENLQIPFDVVPIAEAHAAFEQMLGPVFVGLDPDVTEENIQARCRGVVLMAMSNKFGSLLVTTGNKSELAVGYCTLYGDMAGGLAILSDVPKMMVWTLARWINEDEASPLLKQFGKSVIPEATIVKPPSAELRPDQTDQDSLPPYEVLDQIIERYVEREQSARQIIDETGIDSETVLRVVRLIDLNEYKRKQAAPGLKVTGRAFGFGRRMPIAQRADTSGKALRTWLRE